VARHIKSNSLITGFGRIGDIPAGVGKAKLSLLKIFVPFMPAVSRPSNQPGDFLVDYEE